MAKFLTLSHLKIFFKSLKEKLSPVAFSGNYEDIIDTPELADVAISGDYNDLKNKPEAGGMTPEEVEQLMQNDLADVAFSGDFYDLTNQPIIPEEGDYVTKGKKNGTTVALYATAEGYGTTSTAIEAHAEGYATTASSQAAHAEGQRTIAKNSAAHAEGYGTVAEGQAAHVEGYGEQGPYTITAVENNTYTLNTLINYLKPGDYLKSNKTGQLYTISTIGSAIGAKTTITISGSVSSGDLLVDSQVFCCAKGASGNYSHSEGYCTRASGSQSHAEGYQTTASNSTAHAEGFNTMASGGSSHAEGSGTKATGQNSHAEGYNTQAVATGAHAEGMETQAIGQASHAEGFRSISIGNNSHTEGQGTATFTFIAKYSTGDNFIITTYPTAKEIKTNQLISITKSSTTYYGYIYEYDSSTDTISVEFKTAPSGLAENDSFTFTVYESGAYGQYSHVEGNGNTAIGEGAHAEGHNNKAIGVYSHVEGQGARASGAYSHAEGETTAATGTHSHAEGSGSIASGQYSHAEGYNSKALAYASHSEGLGSTADGYYAHAEGDSTIAKHRAQHVFGKYNIEDPATGLPLEVGTYVEIVGNGEQNARSNARTLDWNGNEVLAGGLTVSSAGITIGNTTITETQLQNLLALLNS